MLRDHIAEFDDVYGGQGLVIKQLLFVGGASSNGYIRKHIQQQFPGLLISTPYRDSPTLVAKGAIIRSLRRDAIKTTKLSQSLGCAWDEEYDPEVHGEDAEIEEDPCDGAIVVRDCVSWIINKNEDMEMGEQRVREGGWKVVEIDEKGDRYIDKTRDELLRQHIYMSKTQTRDHLPVMDPANDIAPVGYADLTLSKDQMKHFPIIRRGGRRWRKLEYRLRWTYQQTVLTYEFIVPRRGVPHHDSDWENDAFVCSAVLETDVVFDWGQQNPAKRTKLVELPASKRRGKATSGPGTEYDTAESDDEIRPSAAWRGEIRRFRAPRKEVR